MLVILIRSQLILVMHTIVYIRQIDAYMHWLVLYCNWYHRSISIDARRTMMKLLTRYNIAEKI